MGFTCDGFDADQFESQPDSLRKRNRLRLVISNDASGTMHHRLDFDMNGFVAMFFDEGKTRTWNKSYIPEEVPVGVAAFGVAAISLADDLGHIRSFRIKLAAQFSAALVLVVFGIVFRTMSLPILGSFELGWWGYPMTVFWIVAMTNIFNFMDWLDGLAGGCGLIVAIFFGVEIFIFPAKKNLYTKNSPRNHYISRS